MATLTKADAARQLGIARSTLYKLIDQGKVSPMPDGRIDQAELVRVAAYTDTVIGRPRTHTRYPQKDTLRHLSDVRRQMTANVRRRRQTPSWTSCSDRSRCCVTNSTTPTPTKTPRVNVKRSCSTWWSRCSTATTASSTCPALHPRNRPRTAQDADGGYAGRDAPTYRGPAPGASCRSQHCRDT
jgi:transposase-like protein